jgi:hypothetical protein
MLILFISFVIAVSVELCHFFSIEFLSFFLIVRIVKMIPIFICKVYKQFSDVYLLYLEFLVNFLLHF